MRPHKLFVHYFQQEPLLLEGEAEKCPKFETCNEHTQGC